MSEPVTFTLHGDGINDDTEAFQILFDHGMNIIPGVYVWLLGKPVLVKFDENVKIVFGGEDI